MPTPRRPLFGLTLLVLLIAAAAPAGAEAPVVDTAGLQALLRDAPRTVFLLDVRTPREYAGGRVPGAVLIPMNQVPNRLAEIPTDKKIVVICATGARSGAVARYLQQNGYPNAVNYVGGTSAWIRSGAPVER